MKTLLLRRDHEAAELEGQFADPSHVDQTLDRTTVLRSLDTGRITALLLCNVLPPELSQARV